ncbi:MAG: AAA family ATPase [Candidatus Sedimenticola sp. 20ELBAFRAG]
MTEKLPPGGPSNPERPLHKPRFGLRRAGELTSNTSAPIWLIKKFLEDKTLSLLFAEPESGKSLLALSMAAAISTGTQWFGRDTDPGLVVYIAGEGHNGIGRRLKALEIHHGISLDDAPLYVSWSAASIIEIESVHYVVEAVEEAISETGLSPKLIIIDTLARNFGAGNENSTSDMNQVIQHVDWYLKDKFNSSVLIVHHTGHGDKNRGRGSSVLKAAVDSEYMLTKSDDAVRLIATKMKDADYPDPMGFEIEVIDLEITDEDGGAVTSAVLSPREYVKPPPKRDAGLGRVQKRALAELSRLCIQGALSLEDNDASRVTFGQWRSKLEKEEITKTRQSFFKVKQALLERRLIKIDGDYVEVINDL